MKCPRCGGPLVAETLGGKPLPVGGPFRSVDQPEMPEPEQAVDLIIIDRCKSCQGLWFDEGEVTDALQGMKLKTLPALPGPPDSPRPGPIGACPRCNGELETLQSQAVPEVEYDRCTKCHGVWFDPGEAEQFGDRHVGLLALMLQEFG